MRSAITVASAILRPASPAGGRQRRRACRRNALVRAGWPARTRAFRRQALRLWRPPAGDAGRRIAEATVIALLICGVYAFYIYIGTVLAPPRPAPNLGDYPTTALR